MARGDEITTKFKVDISDLKKGITEANKQIKLANAEFKAASAGMDDWAKSSDGIRAKLKQLSDIIGQEKSKLEAYKKQFSEITKAQDENGKRADELRKKLKELSDNGVSKTSEEYKKYQKALTEVEKEQQANKDSADKLRVTILNQQGAVSKAEKDFDNFSDTLKQVEKAEEEAAKTGKSVDDALKDMEDSANKAGDGFTVMKGALASLVADGIRKAVSAMKDFAKSVVDVGTGFDNSMSQVAAVSGATGKDLEDLRDKAKEMGSTTKFTASEAADAFNYMAMAGWKTEDMLSGINGILNLAAASGSDLATTSDIVTDALTAMGYKAKDAGRLADVMAAASSNANTNVEMMGATFQYAAPIVGALGYKMEDTAVAIGLMANSGIKGEKAGTALRSVLTRLSAPPAEASKAMEALGISVTNTDGSMRPLAEVMETLRSKFSGLSESQQTQYAKSLAGQEAMSGLLAIVNAAPADYDKLTAAVKNSSGAAEQMSKTMMNNVGGDLTKLKSQFEGIQLQVYEKLVPAIRDGIKNISKALKNVNWDSFAKTAGNAFKKVTDTFALLVKNGDKVKTVIKLMLAAFVVTKINSFTKGISDLTTKMIANTVAATTNQKTTTLFTNVTKAATIAQNAQTVATNAGTMAANAFSAAWKANPIGLIVTGLTLAMPLITKFAGWLKEATKETDADVIATNKLVDSHNKLTEEINKSTTARKNAIDKAGEETAVADVLLRKLDDLAGVEDKTNSQKETMKRLVSELNAIMPELNLKYDEEKDALNKSTEAIKSNIQATKDLAKAKVAQEQLTEIAEQMAKLEMEQGDLIANNTKLTKKYQDAQTELAEFTSKYSYEQINSNGALIAKYNELTGNVYKTKDALTANQGALDGNQQSLSKLNGEYDKTTQYADRMYNQAEIQTKIAALTDLAKAQGREIPEALAQGMLDGNYAVPESIEQMNNLINFDNALSESKLAGTQIPASISEGIMSGKVGVETALAQVQEVVNFNKALEQAKADGVKIPKNLSDNMLSGKYSIDEANAQLNQAIEFNEMAQKATDDGIKVPTNLAKSIKNGKMLPQQAIDEMKALLSYDDAVTKAGEAGVKIPNALKAKIEEGKMLPSEAIAAINDVMSYQAMIDKAGLEGVQVPATLRNKILEGKVTVEEANAQMNSWINFNKSLETSGMAGVEIPSVLARNVLSGKASVEDAKNQMNNWIEFSAALDASNKAGAKIPTDLQTSILNGKLKPLDALKQLNASLVTESNALQPKIKTSFDTSGKYALDGFNAGMKNETKRKAIQTTSKGVGTEALNMLKESLDEHSPSKKTEEAGKYFLDGLRQGIDNQDRRSGIFNSIASFGASLLAKLKSALAEKSPSKATTQMGEFLLEGLGIGIDNEEDGVLKQVEKFGKNVVETLSDELKESAGLQEMVENVQGSLSKARSTISSIKIPSIAGGGALAQSSLTSTSNVNNFTQIINAPQQPSRIELYRQTRNLMELRFNH